MIGIVGEESAWDKESWESLGWLKDEVEKLKPNSPGLKLEYIKTKEEVLGWM